MKASTAQRIAQAIQLLRLDGFEDYSSRQLSDASGVSPKTIRRNKDIVTILDFVIGNGGYARCILQV